MRESNNNISNNTKDWLLATLIAVTMKVLTVPPTQPWMVWMKKSQTLLNASVWTVMKETYARGLMAGTFVGMLREAGKTPIKYLTLTACDNLANNIELPDNKHAKRLTKALINAGPGGLIEGPFAAFFNGWVTWKITSDRGESYLEFLREGPLGSTQFLESALSGNKGAIELLKNRLVTDLKTFEPAVIKSKNNPQIFEVYADVAISKMQEGDESIIEPLREICKAKASGFDTIKKAFRGLMPTVCKQGFTNGLLVLGNLYATEHVAPLFKDYSSNTQKFAIAFTTASAISLIVAPLETIMTQVQKFGAVDKGFFENSKKIYNQHGAKVFYRGTLQKVVLLATGMGINAGYVGYLQSRPHEGQEGGIRH